MLFGVAGCAVQADPAKPEISEHSDELRQSIPLSVLDFGADRSGGTSSHRAFSLALEYLRDNRGGVLYVPRGTYKFTAPLTFLNLNTYTGGIRIVGDGDGTEILPSVPGVPLFQFHNAPERISFSDLAFVGSGSGSTVDVGSLIHASYCHAGLEIDRCTFSNIRSNLAGTISTNLTDLVLRGSHFGGCAGLASVYSTEVRNTLIEDCRFIDYDSRAPKTGHGNGVWIHIDKPNGGSTALEQGSCILRGLRLDEGASPQIHIGSDDVRYENVLVEDITVNVSGVTGGLGGLYAKNIENLSVKRSRFAWGRGGRDVVAVNLSNVGVAELEYVKATDVTQVIRADALTQYLWIKDCSYGILQSQAQRTRIEVKGNIL